MKPEKHAAHPPPHRIVATSPRPKGLLLRSPGSTGNLRETAREILVSICLRLGSLRDLGTGSGHSSVWVWRQIRHNKRLDLEKIFELLEHVGVPPRFFLQELMDHTPEYEPAWLLDYLRLGLPDPGARGDLGEARPAGESLVLASELALQSGQIHHAHRFAREAVEAVQLPRGSGRRSALLQLAKVLRHLGRLEPARIAALAGLRSRDADPSSRSRAWFELAKIAGRQGRDRRALVLLARAERPAREQAGCAWLFWWKGVLLARVGSDSAAYLPLLSKTLRLFRSSHQPEPLFLVAADLVELLAPDNPERALKVARRLGPALPLVAEAVQDLWLDLSALLSGGRNLAALGSHLAGLRRLLRPKVLEAPPVPLRRF